MRPPRSGDDPQHLERLVFECLDALSVRLVQGASSIPRWHGAFHEHRLLFHGPPGNSVRYDVVLVGLDFGMISVDGACRSQVEIVNAGGVTVASHVVER